MPQSKATSGQKRWQHGGLDTAPGQAFIHAIHKARAINPPYVAVENVPGITANDYNNTIITEIKKAGYAVHNTGI